MGSALARKAGNHRAGLRVTHALMGAPSAGGLIGCHPRALRNSGPLYGPHRQKSAPSCTRSNGFA